jgi:hypothetical protein
MMRCTWILSLLLLILPACLHNSQARVLKSEKSSISAEDENGVKRNESAQKRAEDPIDYRLKALSLEAKYSDIPIPLGSEPLYDFFKQLPFDERSIMFGYTNKTGISELYNYFKAEFMRLGWSFMGGIQDIESMLTFEKPDRVCSVSLRPSDDSDVFIIMVYPKDSEACL